MKPFLKWLLGIALCLLGLTLLLLLTVWVVFRFSDQANGSVVSSGEERRYLLYVPESYARPHRCRWSSACMDLLNGRRIRVNSPAGRSWLTNTGLLSSTREEWDSPNVGGRSFRMAAPPPRM
jgi:hypothetical protein